MVTITKCSSLQKAWVNYTKKFYEIDPRVNLIKVVWVNLLTLRRKLDIFIAMQQNSFVNKMILLIKRKSKFTPKKFYEIDPSSTNTYTFDSSFST